MKTEKLKNHSLEIEEDISAFKRGIVVQRIGWAAMAIFISCGIIGLFGTGPLSHKEEKTSAIELKYDQYLRFENETELRIKARPSQGDTRISFPEHYFNYVSIKRITPEPKTSFIENGRYTFTFPIVQQGTIVFSLRTEEVGNVKATLKVNKDDISISHFIYP